MRYSDLSFIFIGYLSELILVVVSMKLFIAYRWYIYLLQQMVFEFVCGNQCRVSLETALRFRLVCKRWLLMGTYMPVCFSPSLHRSKSLFNPHSQTEVCDILCLVFAFKHWLRARAHMCVLVVWSLRLTFLCCLSQHIATTFPYVSLVELALPECVDIARTRLTLFTQLRTLSLLEDTGPTAAIVCFFFSFIFVCDGVFTRNYYLCIECSIT